MTSEKCEVCLEVISKYKCPGCLARTCSVQCVKRHKKQSSCSGQRDRAAYVGVKNFTEGNLLSDYMFLEGATRSAENAFKDWKFKPRDRPKHCMALIREAFHRGTKVYLLPFATSRRMENSSFFHFRERVLYWKVQWVFVDADVKYTDKKVHENTVLEEVLRKTFVDGETSDPITRHKLKRYLAAGLGSWRLFIKQEKRPANDERYFPLSVESDLKTCLKGVVVIEHPVIHVALEGSPYTFPLMPQEAKEVESEKKCSDDAVVLDSTSTRVEKCSDEVSPMTSHPSRDTAKCNGGEGNGDTVDKMS